jgi:AcrR family transcriptional regulator
MDSFAHLMFAPDSCRREDIAADLGLGIVAAGGLGALTTQSVSARARCSRQAVYQWFGGQEELRRVVARCFGARWRRWVAARTYVAGVGGLLPDSEEVVGWCRAWLAVVEHAPRDPEVAAVVDGVRHGEREEIGGVLGRDPDSEPVALVHAVAEGLRLRLCAARPELTVGDAERLLLASVETSSSLLA